MLKVYNVTDMVLGGSQETEDVVSKRVRNLMQVLMSTVRPDTWLTVGGAANLGSFYNRASNRWYVIVFHPDDVSADLQSVLDGLKAP